ncbi:hypothetical protein CLV63_101194 [Murinocardiopsis flavida]|uniref:DUF3558 domain-containing protein n=1 Tax=Murinocardiopsis flavida TaxID=645275 RepID=A0A2P8DU22_9ACTN|nr:hypothetical protein [Murinocardiopsis flavida]PSL00720.1 hypothetical protein CLV63_101194 [Murinocardiopsis flavida]
MRPWVQKARLHAGRVQRSWQNASRLQTALVGGIAVVLLSVGAVATGLTVGADGPAAAAAPADVHASAPGCATVGDDAVEQAVPSAVLETAERGPLSDASGSSCAWTSLNDGAAPARSISIDFEAHYTDKSGEVSGDRRASEQLRRLAPVGGLEGAVPVNALGEGALAWPSRSGGSTAEVAFRSDNLVVRVFYGGDEAAAGPPMSYDAAREGAVGVAESVKESL